MGKHLGLGLWCLWLAACGVEVTRGNPYDPAGEGPKAPGRIGGQLVLQGASSQAGHAVEIYDAAQTRVDGNTTATDASGSFLSPELTPGTYRVVIDVPVTHQAVERSGIVVVPGVTTALGPLLSLQLPADGELTGSIQLEQTSIAPAGVRVLATHTTTGMTALAYSSATGAYRLVGLVPGAYEVRADLASFTPDRASVSVEASTRSVTTVPTLHLYPASAVVRFEVTGPNGTVLGAAHTRTTSVNLLLLAFGGVNEMRLADNPRFEDALGCPVAFTEHLAQVPWTLTSGEGEKSVYAQFRMVDGDGVERLLSEAYVASIVLDQSPPAISSLVVAPDALVVGGTRYVVSSADSVQVQVVAEDPLSLVAGVRYPLDGAAPTSLPYDDVTSSTAVVTLVDVVGLSAGDGAKSIGVQLVDAAGNESSVITAQLVRDRAGPVLLSLGGGDEGIRLEGGAAETRATTAFVEVAAADATSKVSEFKLSPGVDCAGGTWQEFDDDDDDGLVTALVALAPGDRVSRAVSVQFRDVAGNLSACASDEVLVDTAAPRSPIIMALDGSDAVAPGHTNEDELTVLLDAHDATSVQVSLDASELDIDNPLLPPIALVTTPATTSLCLGGGLPGACTPLGPTSETVRVYARFYDALGNGSDVVSASIVVDNEAPGSPTLVLPAVGNVTQRGPTLYARDVVITAVTRTTAEPGLEMRLSVDGVFDAEPWMAYALNSSVVLDDAQCPSGLCTVRAIFRDPAGNETLPVSATVVLDTEPPTAPRVAAAAALVTDTAFTLEILPGFVHDPNFLRFEVSGGADWRTFGESIPALGGLPSTTTSFPVRLEENVVNTLRIRAVDAAGNVSADDFMLVTHDSSAPVRPSALRAVAYDGELHLTWNASSSADVARYKVYYGTLSGVYRGTDAAQGPSPITIGLTSSFNLTGLVNGNTVYVAVTAVDAAGLESDASPEAVQAPSRIAPQLLSQVGGSVERVWLDPADQRLYVPRDGGLDVLLLSGGGSQTTLYSIEQVPDPTQVIFHHPIGAGARPWVFVHGSDPALGPVTAAPDQMSIFDGMPNPDAPVRVLRTFDATNGLEVARLDLPERTMTFELFYDPGTGATRGISVSSGFTIVGTDSPDFLNAPSELVYWALDPNTGRFRQEGAPVVLEAAAGWAVTEDRSALLVGTYPTGSFGFNEFLVRGPTLTAYAPFGAHGEVIDSLTYSLANDGLQILIGPLRIAKDIFLSPYPGDNPNEPQILQLTDLARLHTTGMTSHGTFTLGFAYPPTVSGDVRAGSSDRLDFDPSDLGTLAVFMLPPAFVGHVLHVTLDGVTTDHVITDYTLPTSSTGDGTFFITPSLTGSVDGFGDTWALDVDQTPAANGVMFSDPECPSGRSLQRFAADPGMRRIFAVGQCPPADTDTTIVREYSVGISGDVETTSYVAKRSFSATPTNLSVVDGRLIVVLPTELLVLPLAGWSTPSTEDVEVPLFTAFHHLAARGGYVYAAPQALSGASTLAVVDMTNPARPETVATLTTNQPVLDLAIDGNRLYVLEGTCERICNPWAGARDCECNGEAQLETFTLTPFDSGYPGTIFERDGKPASATHPVLVAPRVLLGRDHVTDLLPRKRELLLFASRDDGDGRARLLRRNGFGATPPGAKPAGWNDLDVGAGPSGLDRDGKPRETFGLALGGGYAFVPMKDATASCSGSTAAHLIRAYKLASDGTVTTAGRSALGNCNERAPRELVLVERYLYVFEAAPYGGGLRIYDVAGVLDGSNDSSNAEVIVEVGRWDENSIGGGIVVGSYAYVMVGEREAEAELRIVDVSDPAHPTQVHSLRVAAAGLIEDRGLLYVATRKSGLRVYELFRPEAMRSGAKLAPASGIVGSFAVGKHLAFASGEDSDSSQLYAFRIPAGDAGAVEPLFDPEVVFPRGTYPMGLGLAREYRVAFGDGELWAQDRYHDCGGAPNEGKGCVQLLDTSSLGFELMSRKRSIAPFLAPSAVTPFGEGGACSSSKDCCAFQRCDSWSGTCMTPPPQVLKVVQTRSTEYIALAVQGSAEGGDSEKLDDNIGPNAGLYVFDWTNPDSAPVLRGGAPAVRTVETTQSSCAADDAELGAVNDIVYSQGVLYAVGTSLVAARADDLTASWGSSDASLFTRRRPPTDKPANVFCGRRALAHGGFLYLMGDSLGTGVNDRRCRGSTHESWSRTLWIYDIATPIAPVLVSTLRLTSSVQSMTLSGNRLYFGQSNPDRVLVVDVTNRAAPFEAAGFTLQGDNRAIEVSGSLLLVNGGASGINVVDGR